MSEVAHVPLLLLLCSASCLAVGVCGGVCATQWWILSGASRRSEGDAMFSFSRRGHTGQQEVLIDTFLPEASQADCFST